MLQLVVGEKIETSKGTATILAVTQTPPSKRGKEINPDHLTIDYELWDGRRVGCWYGGFNRGVVEQLKCASPEKLAQHLDDLDEI